jgi:regulator of protease activity HflC (stomatin/prohibitin superfamily)
MKNIKMRLITWIGLLSVCFLPMGARASDDYQSGIIGLVDATNVWNLDTKPSECLTEDNKMLVMNVRVKWSTTDKSVFTKSFPRDSMALAQRQLTSMVYEARSQVVGLHNLSDFVNPDGSAVRLGDIQLEIAQVLQAELNKKNSGIKIESLRISSVKQR